MITAVNSKPFNFYVHLFSFAEALIAISDTLIDIV
jgi:hypothetical protein